MDNQRKMCLTFIIIVIVNITSSYSVTDPCQNLTNKIDVSPQLFWKISTSNNATSDHELDVVEYLYEIRACTNYTFKVSYIPPTVQYILVQAHSYLYSVTLSEISPLEKTVQQISGVNIGLVRITDTTEDPIFNLANENPFAVSVLLAVISYGENAPIPGGCNLEFELKTSPFQKLNRSSSMIQVDAQPSRMSELWSSRFMSPCGSKMLTYEHYLLYLSSGDFKSETYFDGIRKMLSVERIRENGRKIVNSNGPNLRKTYSAYLGTGSVYALLVKTNDGSYSAYVPIHTYACKPEYSGGTCVKSSIILFFISCTWGIIGVFLCFVGNKKSKLESTLMLALLIGLVLCVFFLNYHSSEIRLKTSAFISVIIGCFISSIFVQILEHCDVGIGVIAYLIDSIMMGLLLASTLFYTPVADHPNFDDHGVFWITFAAFTLIVLLLLFGWTHTFDELPPAFVGAYCIILFLEYFTNTNLGYIVINTIRRATTENFNSAIISPPYSKWDFIMITIWGILTIIGIRCQPKKSFSTQNTESLTSVIQASRQMYNTCTIAMANNSSDNVFLSDNDEA